MRKVLVLCAALFSLGSVGILHAQESVQSYDLISAEARVNIKGSLGTVYVDTNQSTFTFSVTAPRENIIGTSPTCTWSVNNNILTISVRQMVIGIERPGDSAVMGIAVSDGGVYEITVIGR